jgi:hypothetical protein
VRLATSYYSDDVAEHEVITKGRGNYAQTKANIVEALRRSIPLRVGLVEIRDGQRVEQARDELETLGVTEIGTDHLRQVGRGVRQRQPSIDQLYGHCARGKSRCHRMVTCGHVCSVVDACGQYPAQDAG